jgi:hypothetical protein
MVFGDMATTLQAILGSVVVGLILAAIGVLSGWFKPPPWVRSYMLIPAIVGLVGLLALLQYKKDDSAAATQTGRQQPGSVLINNPLGARAEIGQWKCPGDSINIAGQTGGGTLARWKKQPGMWIYVPAPEDPIESFGVPSGMSARINDEAIEVIGPASRAHVFYAVVFCGD